MAQSNSEVESSITSRNRFASEPSLASVFAAADYFLDVDSCVIGAGVATPLPYADGVGDASKGAAHLEVVQGWWVGVQDW